MWVSPKGKRFAKNVVKALVFISRLRSKFAKYKKDTSETNIQYVLNDFSPINLPISTLFLFVILKFYFYIGNLENLFMGNYNLSKLYLTSIKIIL